ncbi:MAG: large conductance mechanosensitive channel protein MscL [Bdellovibrionales bacterium]|nr:large conductance mechanosensitive channel protein MscL [Bdellovibrionales bacterium]
MLKEFKEFAVKGNMLDLAVGIILGAAFGTIVNSLVNDIIMPIISGILRMPDFSNLFVVLRNPTDQAFTSVDAAREAGAAVLAYGLFINAIISFLIVAFALFLVVKGYNNLKAQIAKEEEAAPVEPPRNEVLLQEIRDILAKRTV